MNWRKTAATLLLSTLPMVASAWWSDDWEYRKELQLDLTPAGADVAGTPTDVPVLVRLSLANFAYFADASPDGRDLRFVAGDDKTPLKHHVERFDATNQLAYVWVKVPRLAGGTNTEKVYLYYGNPDAPPGGDPAGTYDPSQVLVYHFGEDAGPPVDRTAYGNNPSQSTAVPNPASLIGGGVSFAGAQTLVVPSSASLRAVPDRGFTFSTWLRIGQAQAGAQVLTLRDAAGSALVLGINGMEPYARLAGPAGNVELPGGVQLATDQWHHLAVVARADRLELFVDGLPVAAADARLPEIIGDLTVGGSPDGANFFVGDLDELQVSNVARSAEWLKAAARSQGFDAPLVVYGADAQREGGDASYIAITMQNVTVDGWVVIVILAVMFVISLLIMFNKAVYLGRVHKANAAFLREFSKLRGDPTALDREEGEDEDEALDLSPFVRASDGKDNPFRMSTIYRLYHTGVQALAGRMEQRAALSASAVRSLSPQSIEAIRAAMDASQVRMSQKLSANMVLLTIAISGGPFLGLLGTVVGVMITFAAIAASGDVNVNSIAPGIAAALAATVAGLAVAIPALFGYNWLNTRIKEINADMRVFVDEFVTRVAEHYT